MDGYFQHTSVEFLHRGGFSPNSNQASHLSSWCITVIYIDTIIVKIIRIGLRWTMWHLLIVTVTFTNFDRRQYKSLIGHMSQDWSFYIIPMWSWWALEICAISGIILQELYVLLHSRIQWCFKVYGPFRFFFLFLHKCDLKCD